MSTLSALHRDTIASIDALNSVHAMLAACKGEAAVQTDMMRAQMAILFQHLQMHTQMTRSQPGVPSPPTSSYVETPPGALEEHPRVPILSGETRVGAYQYPCPVCCIDDEAYLRELKTMS